MSSRGSKKLKGNGIVGKNKVEEIRGILSLEVMAAVVFAVAEVSMAKGSLLASLRRFMP